MVSTRGVKFKFSEGEKVLCYEPDPSKAKVLYDSKVLSVVQKGRKSVEYLIHFQGWNSSWDRYVPGEFVLKDTVENRQLQKSLAEKSQLQLGVFFYRKERSQQRGSLSKPDQSVMEKAYGFEILDEDDDVIVLSDVEVEGELEDEVEGELEDEEEDEEEDAEEEEDMESEGEDNEGEDSEDEPNPFICQMLVGQLGASDIINLELPKEFKRMLEEDQNRIKNQNMFVRIPANPTIITILEEYVKQYAHEILATEDESKTDSDHESMRIKQASLRMQPPRKRVRRSSSNSSCDGEEMDKELEQLLRSVRICSEIAYSLMVYIDFTLGDQLLYENEKEQYFEVKELAEKRKLTDIKLRHNPPPLPVQQRLLARIDSEIDSEDDGKSDTEAELLQMISAMDEGFAQRWNDLLRDAGCETDPETDPLKAEEELDKHQEAGNVMGGEEDPKETDMLSQKGKVVVCPATSSNSPSCSRNSDRGSGTRSTRGAAATPSTSAAQQNAQKKKQFLEEIMGWRLVPEEFLRENDPTLSQLYGAVHLARLMVKLPAFLFRTSLKKTQLATIQKHLNFFLRFITKKSIENEWFGQQHYYVDLTNL